MQNQLIDFYRSSMKTAAEMARISIENGIRLQERQLEIVRGILDEQARSADELAGAKSMEELVAVQSRMASVQLGRLVEFWSSVWQAAAQNQGEALRNVQSFTRSSEDVARAAANQVSRGAGSIRESGGAASHRKSA